MTDYNYIMLHTNGELISVIKAPTGDTALWRARWIARQRCIFSFTLAVVIAGCENVAANHNWP